MQVAAKGLMGFTFLTRPISRYSKKREYDMREEATPWPSSALAAPTLPKAGSTATLAARALQQMIELRWVHPLARTGCNVPEATPAYFCRNFLRLVELLLSCNAPVWVRHMQPQKPTTRLFSRKVPSRPAKSTHCACLNRSEVSSCPCMLAYKDAND